MEELINESINGTNIEKATDSNPGALEKESDTTYVINSIEDLVFFSYDVRNGNSYEGKTVKLEQSVDFNSMKSYVDAFRTDYGKYGYDGELKTLLTSGEGFKPIGTYILPSGTSESNNFKGTFDGNNKTISNLTITMSAQNDEIGYAALFGINDGTIMNLNLKNTNIITTGYFPSSGIAASSTNLIKNCRILGGMIQNTSDSWAPTGGICAIMEANSTIENCGNDAAITRINQGTKCGGVAGGIVGQSSDNAIAIKQCYNTGKILGIGENIDWCIGGIIGYSRNDIENCYNTGEIVVKSNISKNVGGIVGYLDQKKLSNCYNIGKIQIDGQTEQSKKTYIGGIVGCNYMIEIKNAYNIGEITVNPDNQCIIGGITAGRWNEKISNACNIGKIYYNDTENEKIGSIIGNKIDVTLSNCYYLKNTYSKGIGYLNSSDETTDGIEEKENIENMPTIMEIINVDNVFGEDNKNINNGYPILVWMN